MQRFMGMTCPVAETLAHKIFCVLKDPQDNLPRMTAAEFFLVQLSARHNIASIW